MEKNPPSEMYQCSINKLGFGSIVGEFAPNFFGIESRDIGLFGVTYWTSESGELDLCLYELR